MREKMPANKLKDKYDNTTILGQNVGIELNAKKNSNTFVFGASNTGKTRNFVVPNILEKCGSYVVLDSDGHIYNETSEYMSSDAKRKYNVLTLNLKNPEKSHHYNLFKYIKYADNDDIALSIRNIANVFNYYIEFYNHYFNASTQDAFSVRLKKELFYAGIRYVYDGMVETDQTIQSAITILNLFARDNRSEMYKNLLKDFPKDSDMESIFHKFNMYPDSAYYVGTTQCISYLNNAFKDVIDITDNDTLDLEYFTDRPTILYIITDSIHPLRNVLADILCMQIFNVLLKQTQQQEGALYYPVRFFFDEFTNVYIPNIDLYMLHSMYTNIHVNLITIDPENIIKQYGPQIFYSIISMCNIFLYAGADDYYDNSLYNYFCQIGASKLKLKMDNTTHIAKDQMLVFYKTKNSFNKILTKKIQPNQVI